MLPEVKRKKRTKLDDAIDSLLDQMLVSDCSSKEYFTMVDQLTKLYKLREVDTPKRVSPDTLVLVAGNLIGIVVILGYEKANVITSRALGFVMKLR